MYIHILWIVTMTVNFYFAHTVAIYTVKYLTRTVKTIKCQSVAFITGAPEAAKCIVTNLTTSSIVLFTFIIIYIKLP